MDLIDKLKAIAERLAKTKDSVGTEEATKNAFIMPFIAALGYDVFNPLEVVPEYIADVGIKKGEKVDYCIFKNGRPIIIIECKHWNNALTNNNSQLSRYFHVTSCRFAILTNGVKYRFYSDLDEKNKMDTMQFFEFDITKLDEQVAAQLKRFTKENFDEEDIAANASDMKYSRQIRELMIAELKTPSEDFVKYLISKVYAGRMTGKVLEQFNQPTITAVKQLVNDLINERLQMAISNEPSGSAGIVDDIVTTEEEISGFRIVQAILAKYIDVNRVTYKDVKTYFGILLDDNSRKPICRLYFNGKQKYLGLFDAARNEDKLPISCVEDIYASADKIVGTLESYNPNEKN